MDDKHLFISITNRQGTIFESMAKSVTSFNEKGKFDVLPYHTNFIALVNNKIITRTLKNTIEEIEISSGIMRVKGNRVEVYLGVKQEL